MKFWHEVAVNTCKVQLEGSFTYADHEIFRDILTLTGDTQIVLIVLECSGIEFVDSAALGMLLLMRERATLRHQKIIIRGAKGQVERLFKLSKFDTLFTLEAA